jgi:hypothetical protein
MVKNWFRKDKSLEESLEFLRERSNKELSKGKFKKVEKLMNEYNNLLDSLWATRPSKYPMRRMKYLDKNESKIIYEAGKCEFCGSGKKYIEILPYLFGSILPVYLCERNDCRKAYEEHKDKYLGLLQEAHEELVNGEILK